MDSGALLPRREVGVACVHISRRNRHFYLTNSGRARFGIEVAAVTDGSTNRSVTGLVRWWPVKTIFIRLPKAKQWFTALEAIRFRFDTEYFEAVDTAKTNHDRGETEMPKYRHIEVLRLGPVSRVRLLNHRRFYDEEEAAELTSEWNSVADRADCHAFFVDCSNVQVLSSEILSRLISLDRRLKQKGRKLMLCGLRPAIRDVLRWTNLDQLIEIKEDEGQEVIALE